MPAIPTAAAMLAAILSLLPVSAKAQTRVDGANLFVDLKDYIGKEVVLVGGKVFSADNSGALLDAGGVTFKLTIDGMDRETLRFILKNCTGIMTPDPCRVPLQVIPTGAIHVNFPILKSAKLAN